MSTKDSIAFDDLTDVVLTPDGATVPGVLLKNDDYLTALGSQRVAAALRAFFEKRAIAFER